MGNRPVVHWIDGHLELVFHEQTALISGTHTNDRRAVLIVQVVQHYGPSIQINTGLNQGRIGVADYREDEEIAVAVRNVNVTEECRCIEGVVGIIFEYREEHVYRNIWDARRHHGRSVVTDHTNPIVFHFPVHGQASWQQAGFRAEAESSGCQTEW